MDIEDILARLEGEEGVEMYWEAENGVERDEMRSPSPDIEVGKEVEKGGISLWDLLRDEAGAEEWEGWIVDGKWCGLPLIRSSRSSNALV